MKKLLRGLRHFYLARVRWHRYSFGKNYYIGRYVSFWAKHNIETGDNFYIGRFSMIECDAQIGHNVMLANCVALIGRHDHNFTEIGKPVRLASRIRDENYNWKGLDEKVVIEDDVWIGHGSVILSGTCIGQGSIVAAGSVVTKDVEPYTIVAGNPARKIKFRFSSDKEKQEHILLYNQKYKR